MTIAVKHRGTGMGARKKETKMDSEKEVENGGFFDSRRMLAFFV